MPKIEGREVRDAARLFWVKENNLRLADGDVEAKVGIGNVGDLGQLVGVRILSDACRGVV